MEPTESVSYYIISENISIDMGKYQDINSICGVVKLFLRMLPQPLITSEVFASFAYENGSESYVMVDYVT
jgi:hypothetical protein